MAGILKVDTIQNANADNIITQTNSTTLTIGASGDTVTLAAGATSSGFGATYNGAVNWDTTAKTTTVTAASGVGYFVNTTAGAITVNLPAGVAGSIVALADYAGTWQTNNVTVNANGSEKIGGAAAPATLNTKGQAVTFVYVDSTRGWINTGDATFIEGAAYVAATGGTITTCGNYKIHSFTGPGTFTVTNAGGPTGSNSVEYLVVAGGGGGGAVTGGGGGAGGFIQNYPSPAIAGLPVSVTSYPITVGGGGAAQPNAPGVAGSNSIFSTITSAGGGAGGGGGSPTQANRAGGSGGSGGGGGGGGSDGSGAGAAGSGNTPPVAPSQGNSGAPSAGAPSANNRLGGGGGGATASGSPGPTSNKGGDGGAGTATSITGSPVTYAGGGGGGSRSPAFGASGPRAAGGAGGGGYGGGGPDGGANGQAGTANTGGGGGAGQYGGTTSDTGSAGGSGIVVIRYKFQ
jgi:hypothetical protein